MKNKNIFAPDYVVEEDRLLCPSCFLQLDIEMILHNSTFSWPEQNWILFLCPKCKAKSHIEVKNNLVKTGELDGAPGPCFVACSQQFSDDLIFDKGNYNGILLVYNNVTYKFPAHK